jgi:hypothetical protein
MGSKKVGVQTPLDLGPLTSGKWKGGDFVSLVPPMLDSFSASSHGSLQMRATAGEC